jgi:hypothetical protein
MTRTVDELWQVAHSLYARARSSADPEAKRILMVAADDYLKQANDIRRGQIVKAEFPRAGFPIAHFAGPESSFG